jgi:meiotically up-regulated gene 157 (Mug157) protein
MRMLYFYWKQSPRSNAFYSVLLLPSVQEAVEIMVDLWIAEQKHELDHFPTGPLFDCRNCNKPYRYRGLRRRGKGRPTNATAGLTWSGFRPSDDECTYGYLVPANMFAVVVLEYMMEMASDLWLNAELSEKAGRLAKDIDQGIQTHGIVGHPQFGRIYAYEVDGLGKHLLMDDANVPSLLSAPYLGYAVDETVYANTRNFIFSKANPTFRQGTNELTGEIKGYGSVHMIAAIRNNIWPMSLAVQGLVSDSLEEKIQLAETLVKASAGTGWMHESIDVQYPHNFTRAWFCWADSLFAELVMSITDECPLSNHKYKVHEWRDPVKVAGGVYAAD